MNRPDVVPAPAAEVAAALRLSAAAGPFFAVAHDRVPSGGGDRPARRLLPGHDRVPVHGAGDGWLPAAALVEPGDDLAGAIESVRRWASDTRPRVAASLFFMSYTARLLSAAVAGVLLGGVLVDLRPHEWRYLPGTGLQLRLPVASGWRPAPGVDPDVLLAVLGDELVDGRLAPVVESIRSVVPVAAGLLWGNAASSLAGALQGLAAAGVAVPRCRQVGDVLLALPRLRDTGAFVGAGLAFRRRSCCLFYLLPGSGKCSDCVLLAPR